MYIDIIQYNKYNTKNRELCYIKLKYEKLNNKKLLENKGRWR